MVDEEAGTPAATESAPDLGWHPVGANPKDPGWYPSGVNPNEQAHWDGQTWTAKRRWTVTGWVEEGAPAAAAASGAGPATPRLSANPYSPPAYSKPKTAPATVSVGLLLIMASAITLMYGSVGSWIRLTGSVGIVGLHLNVNGTDPGISHLIGVNGWVTFIAGIVLLVFAGLSLTNDDTLLAVLTALIAGVDPGVRHLRHGPRRPEDPAGDHVPGLQHQRGLGPHRGAQCRRSDHAGVAGAARLEIVLRGGCRRRAFDSVSLRVGSLTRAAGLPTGAGPRTAGRWPCGSVRSCRSSRWSPCRRGGR